MEVLYYAFIRMYTDLAIILRLFACAEVETVQRFGHLPWTDQQKSLQDSRLDEV